MGNIDKEKLERPTSAEAGGLIEAGDFSDPDLNPEDEAAPASEEIISGSLERIEADSRVEIDPYKSQEYLALLREYTPALLSYELKDRFERFEGAVVFVDAQDFSKNTTRLAEEVGEKRAGEEIAMVLGEADEKLIGIAKEYGGFVLEYEGDGRRIFFPSRPGEDSVESARRAVFVASQFQESTKSLRGLRFKSGQEDLRFRVGIDCTTGKSDSLVLTSVGDDYLRTFAAFGGVMSRVDEVQREADPSNRQVAVSQSVRDLLEKSRFRETDSGNFIVSSLHGNDKPAPVDLNEEHFSKDVDVEMLNRFLEAHIPQGRREELRSAVISALDEGKPVEYSPSWDYPRVSTAFIEAKGLGHLLGEINLEDDGVAAHQKLDNLVAEVLQIVHRNSGSVERITGEGMVYAVFEGPSNEYHAAKAAYEAGQFLQRADLEFKAGISTDYAFSGVAGIEGNRTFTQIGKRVNESARLMQTASPNTVVISDSTNRRASHRLRCRELDEPIELKGIGVVDRFAVEGIDYRAGRYAEVEKIVGRDQEQAKIEKLIQKSAQSGKSQVIVLEGEAGVGKTALASKVISDNLEAGKISKLDVRSDEANRKLPLSTVQQFVRQLLEIPDEVENPKDLEARILSKDLPIDMVERLSLLNVVLGTSFVPSEKVKWLDRADQRRETLAVFKDLLNVRRSQIPGEVPVVYLDDWQFIDRQSSDLLIDLMDVTKEDGLVWLVPTRPHTNDIEKFIIDGVKNAIPGSTHEVAVNPFSSFNLSEYPKSCSLREAQIDWFEKNKDWAWPLMCAVFPIDSQEIERNRLAAARITSIVFSEGVSHGNIFYVREVLSHMAMNPDELNTHVFVQHPETNKWHFGDYVLPGETPEMVKEIRKYYLRDEVLEKVGSIEDIEYKKFGLLDSNSKQVLRAMAILGLETTKSMILRITRMPERRLDLCLDQLIDHDMIRDLDNDEFGFIHRITQQTIYSRIAGVGEKQAAHGTVLGILEEEYPDDQERLSSKFFHAKNGGDLLAILRYADLYGRQLKEYGEESGAISVLERGVQAFEELEKQNFNGMDRERILQIVNGQLNRLLDIRLIWYYLSKKDKTREALDDAHSIFHRYYGEEDNVVEYPMEWAAYHAQILSDIGVNVIGERPEEAFKNYSSALAELKNFDALKPSQSKKYLDNLPADVHQKIVFNLSTIHKRVAVYYRNLGGTDNLETARNHAETSVNYARELGHDSYNALASAINGLGIVYRRLNQLEDAVVCYDECFQLAETEGNLPDQATALNNKATALQRLGKPDMAEELLQKALSITQKVFRPQTVAWANASLGSLYMNTDRFDRAIEHFTESLEFFVKDENTFIADAMRIDLVRCYLSSPTPDTTTARQLIMDVSTEDIRLQSILEYLASYTDYLDSYIDFSDFVRMGESKVEFFREDKAMTADLVDLYRFVGEAHLRCGEIILGETFLRRAIKVSQECGAGTEQKMIEAKLRSMHQK